MCCWRAASERCGCEADEPRRDVIVGQVRRVALLRLACLCVRRVQVYVWRTVTALSPRLPCRTYAEGDAGTARRSYLCKIAQSERPRPLTGHVHLNHCALRHASPRPQARALGTPLALACGFALRPACPYLSATSFCRRVRTPHGRDLPIHPMLGFNPQPSAAGAEPCPPSASPAARAAAVAGRRRWQPHRPSLREVPASPPPPPHRRV